jgi:hypothetical protein
MNAYRIQNSIVAAPDEQAAITAWAAHFNQLATAAGPVEDVALTLEIQIEDEFGNYAPGPLSECMPGAGEPAQVVCEGECEGCGSPEPFQDQGEPGPGI